MPRRFAVRLLTWFDRSKRDLPWRRTRDAWPIWVSEVMLQQTRVEAVRTSFERFIAEYPTPASFAAADDEALLAAWRGLGYYRRARLLREGARQVVQDHGGEIPATAGELGELKGVGSYTKGAIASIAFGECVSAIDGNVERVLARHAGIDSDVKRAPARRRFDKLVSERIDPKRPGDFNQALMELGAMVCTPRNPACDRCPVAEDCEARAEGLTEKLPILPQRRKPVEVQARAIVCARDHGRFLAMRIPEGEVNEGQITLPGPGILTTCPTPDDLATALRERFDVRVDVGPEIARVRHGITHHRIELTAHAAELHGRRPSSLLDAAPSDPRAPWTTAARKVLEKLACG